MSRKGARTPLPYQIRPATGADADRIAELDAAALQPPWSAEVYHREIERPDAVVLVAAAAPAPGEVVGFLAARCATDPAEIVRLVVLPSLRRLGLGRRLVEAAFPIFAARAVGRCWLELRESNSTALRFYRAVGFEVCGQRPAYYPDGEAALLMER